MKISHLYKHKQYADVVASWIYNEFWTDKEGVTQEHLLKRLNEAVSDSSIPISLIAFLDNKPVGTINLIENDNENFPDLRPWLAAMYVVPEFRNQGIATKLIYELIDYAKSFGEKEIYLGADIPEFYAKFGARTYKQVTDVFCIMKIKLEN